MGESNWKPVFTAMKPDVIALKAKIDATDWSGGILDDITQFHAIIKEAVKIVEKHAVAVGGLSGVDKKALAVYTLDETIKLPFYIEWADSVVIGAAIDFAVKLFNKKAGSEKKGVSFNGKV